MWPCCRCCALIASVRSAFPHALLYLQAFVVVGDFNGHVGLGVKCAKEVRCARCARCSRWPLVPSREGGLARPCCGWEGPRGALGVGAATPRAHCCLRRRRAPRDRHCTAPAAPASHQTPCGDGSGLSSAPGRLSRPSVMIELFFIAAARRWPPPFAAPSSWPRWPACPCAAATGVTSEPFGEGFFEGFLEGFLCVGCRAAALCGAGLEPIYSSFLLAHGAETSGLTWPALHLLKARPGWRPLLWSLSLSLGSGIERCTPLSLFLPNFC